MNVIKKGSVYWVDFVDVAGKRRRMSTRKQDVRSAREVAGQLVREANMGALTVAQAAQPAVKGVTVAQALDRCLTEVWSRGRSVPTARSNVRALKGYLGDERLSSLTYSKLQAAAEAMEKDGYAPATVKRKMTALGKALTMACRWTDSEGQPLLASKPMMPVIKVRNFCERVISPAEEVAILAAIEARIELEPMRDWRRYGVLIKFLRDTGCRLGEAIGVSRDAITTRQIDGAEVYFVAFPRYETKNEKPRTLPLSPEIVAELDFLFGNAVAGKVFPYRPGTVWTRWKSIREDLGRQGIDIGDVKLHTWRHTCLTRLARRSVRIEAIADWAGHSSIQVTMERYRHMQVEDKLQTLAILTAK